jgi:hypothetical protein
MALLADAFEIEACVAEGLIGSAKGDWSSMERMVKRVCEYDHNTITTLA